MISAPPFKQATSRAQTLPWTSYKEWHLGPGFISPASLAEWLLAKLLTLPISSCESRNTVTLLPGAHIWPSWDCNSRLSSNRLYAVSEDLHQLQHVFCFRSHDVSPSTSCSISLLLLLTLHLGSSLLLCDPAFGITSQQWHKCHLTSSTQETTHLFTGREILALISGLFWAVSPCAQVTETCHGASVHPASPQKKRITVFIERQLYGRGQVIVNCIRHLKLLLLGKLLHKLVAKISFHLKAVIAPFCHHKRWRKKFLDLQVLYWVESLPLG